MQETIVSAAIYHGLIYSLPQPARHHTILRAMPNEIEKICSVVYQGFLTSTGRYVSREEAHDIAWRAGQTSEQNKPSHPTQLFSEDLW